MGFVRTSLIGLVFATASAAMADPGVWGQAESAKDLLFEAMDKSRWLSFESVVIRKMSSKDRGAMQVKVSQRGGMSKTTALSPLPVQGVTTVDDGRSWSTFIPDENRIIIQDSPRRETSRRVKYAAGQNYTFTTEGTANIAGRKAFAVVAEPKASEMPSRRFWIDAEYPLTLKIEVEKDGVMSVMMDTKAISFVTVSEDALKLQPAADVRKIWLPSPERFRSAAEAIEKVGFKPSLPNSLPYGFILNEPQIVGDKADRFVALRLSDGMANATLYQWKSSGPNPVPCTDKRSVREANGLRMRLVGDLPEVVLTKLLEAFVREALKGLMPLLGTPELQTSLHSLLLVCEGPNGNSWVVEIAR